MKVSILFVEAFSVLLFILGFMRCLRKSPARAFEFLMIFVYGLILEILDMHFFKSYRYSSGFSVMFRGVPAAIALLWAVIVEGAMEISDASGIPENARPFLDGLLAVWIDLALDAIAIRMHYWSWNLPLDQGWFGVPAGNLYAWMWVAFFYSVFARAVRLLADKNKIWNAAYLAVPLCSYLFLFIQLQIAGKAGLWLGLRTPDQRLWLFAAQFLVFAFISVYHLYQAKAAAVPPALWTGSRFFMHAYFIVCYFIFGIYRTAPALGWIAAAVLAGEAVFMGKVFKKEAVYGRT